MARKPFVHDPNLPYHVGSRGINQDWFGQPLNEVWEIFQRQLYFLHFAFQFQIHVFVLMGNHFHLLTTAPQGNLSDGMEYFLARVSKELTKPIGRINRVFADRFFRTAITNSFHLKSVQKYILYNPVNAGITERVEDFPFSTIQHFTHGEYSPYPISDLLFYENPNFDHVLDWLNETPEPEVWKCVRAQLKKPVFEPKKSRNSSKPHPLDFSLL